MKTTTLTFFVILLLTVQICPQQYLERQFKGYTNPDELISLSADVGFNQAVELLSKVSESTTGRKIISTVKLDNPVGIEITNMVYDKALVVLVQYHNLTLEEKEDVIIIKRKDDLSINITPDTYASVNSRDVKISAVFFEMDVVESRSRGIDWKVIFNKSGLSIGSELIGTTSSPDDGTGQGQLVKPPNFNLNSASNFDFGSWSGEASALFKFFEEENLGEIIASPNIIVRDRNKGRIQVGSDFSVKKQDFAGNIVETFFPTGTIIEVKPYVYDEDNINYLLLDVIVERSSFIAGETTHEIRKTNAATQVVLLNGEEAVIGGLFINEETIVRTGIPFLKDLPWWVFGLRYVFGSDQKVLRKKELVILLEVEILPTLKERLASTIKKENLLESEVKKGQQKLKYYQFNEQQDNK